MKRILVLASAVCIHAASFAQIADSAKRKVPMQGAANFRDLGGYATKDGHHVKWNKVYRSADISKLTDQDLAELQTLHIHYDVDLRGHQESEKAPDRINPGMDYILCPAGSDSVGNFAASMSKLKGKAGDSMMTAYYSNTQYLADRYKPFFEKLLVAPSDESLLFHCTAGKDRTGIAAALFLYALGVPYSTIEADYEATNYYRADVNKSSIQQMVQYMHLDPEVATEMMSARKQYLEATFAAIKAKYGSVDNFLKSQVGLTDVRVKALKKNYLE